MIRKDSTTPAEDERHALLVGLLVVFPLAALGLWWLDIGPTNEELTRAIEAQMEANK